MNSALAADARALGTREAAGGTLKHEILEQEYEAAFVDEQSYPPSTPFLLRGLAAAIQDSHPLWRPKLSELAGLLQTIDDYHPLVAAGSIYGAGKHIARWYRGPAILLFGAALDAVGVMPNTDLAAACERAKQRLAVAGLLRDPDISRLCRAAKERAQFDRVSEKLRSEFSAGLRRSRRYSEEQIATLVPQIVDASHEVRHRALIGRWVWSTTEIGAPVRFADLLNLAPDADNHSLFSRVSHGDRMVYGTDNLSPVVEAAQIGCAYSLLSRVERLRASA